MHQVAPISESLGQVRPPAPEREASPAFAAILALVVLAGQSWLAMSRHFATILETPFLPYCLVGAFAIHFWTRPGRAERMVTLVLASAAAIAFVLWSGRYRFDWPSSIACGSFLGLSSLTVLAVQTARRRGTRQKATLDTLVAGSIFGYSAIFIAYILNLTTRLHPQTYDLYLYAADAGYGIPICASIAEFVGSRPLLLRACSLVYESLPLAVSLLYAYQRSGTKPIPVRVLPAFIGGGAAAYALYNFLPATGPHYIFGTAFPQHLPAASEAGLHLVKVGDAARNAVPSMHLGCALLIVWACRLLAGWIRAATILFLTLTVLATIGFGEHYVVDLVAAIPYALALKAICAPPELGVQYRTAAIGVGLTLAWLVTLRFGTPLFGTHVFTWGATIATLVICLIAERWSPPPAKVEAGF